MGFDNKADCMGLMMLDACRGVRGETSWIASQHGTSARAPRSEQSQHGTPRLGGGRWQIVRCQSVQPAHFFFLRESWRV
jgi:hypothetical protein